MAMTEQERREMKETVKKRIEESRKKKDEGCLKLILLPIFIVIAYFFWSSREDPSKDPAQISSQNQFLSPKNLGISEAGAKKQIEYAITHSGTFPYDAGSLRRMNPFDYSTRGGGRANIKKYNDIWVKMSNEVAIKVLTSGLCVKLNSVQVMTLTKTPLNPEFDVDCDGKGYKGFYNDIIAGQLMSAPKFDEQQAAAYYAKAPNEFDAANACYETVKAMVQDPDSIDYYPSTGHAGVRPGKDGPERFLTEDFTTKNGFGGTVRNTFYCTVSASGKVSVKYAHR